GFDSHNDEVGGSATVLAGVDEFRALHRTPKCLSHRFGGGEATGVLGRALRPAGTALGEYICLVYQRTTTRDHCDECRRLQHCASPPPGSSQSSINAH